MIIALITKKNYRNMPNKKPAPKIEPNMPKLLISRCHKATVRVSTSDEGTSFYVCNDCGKATDPYIFPKKRVKKENLAEVLGIDHSCFENETLGVCRKCGSFLPPPLKKRVKKEKECEHVWDDSELNPTCHECGKDMSPPCPETCNSDQTHEHVAYTNTPTFEKGSDKCFHD